MKGIFDDKNTLRKGIERVYAICTDCRGKGGAEQRHYNPFKPNPRPNNDEDYIYKWVDCLQCDGTGILPTPYVTVDRTLLEIIENEIGKKE